ncbi:hypothetical protein U9M48_012256 [Paspalum notatum var. saurae]|uniref:Uncharacterized protein n=1 Tax=Paspalum notatum var. saurae TaxID=547442 RepID=A0AAQ3WII0_PASNO
MVAKSTTAALAVLPLSPLPPARSPVTLLPHLRLLAGRLLVRPPIPAHQLSRRFSPGTRAARPPPTDARPPRPPAPEESAPPPVPFRLWTRAVGDPPGPGSARPLLFLGSILGPVFADT